MIENGQQIPGGKNITWSPGHWTSLGGLPVLQPEDSIFYFL